MKAGTKYCRCCKGYMIMGGSIMHEWWCYNPVIVKKGKRKKTKEGK